MALFHIVTGSVNYTLVGTPTLVGGVASGFSNSDYLETTANFNNQDAYTNGMVAQVAITMPAEGAETIGCPLGFGFSTAQADGFNIAASGNILAWRIFGDTNILRNYDKPLSFGQSYVIRGVIANGVATLYCGSDEEHLEQYATKTLELGTYRTPAPATVGCGHRHTNGFTGTINLEKTFISIGGQPWFGICPVEVKELVYRAPNDYTLSGTPTIENGILSGLSSSNSCLLPELPTTFNTMEFLLKVARPDATSTSFIPVLGFGGTGATGRISATGSTGHSVRDGSTIIVEIPNTDFNFVTAANQLGGYFIKLLLTKNTSDYTYTLSCSLDGQTWVTKSENYADNICYGIVSLLRNISGSASGRPQMDLNYSYIKVDGKLWFFHPSARYLIKDNKLVWGAQDLYINDGGTITQATQDLVPVPSGFTYGSTTTNDVGLVDIPTQVFTAHPGATIGQGTPPSPTPSNYTVVGSPTISGNSVSGFSASNYLTLDSVPTGPISSLEFTFNMIHANTYYRTGAYSTLFQSANNVGHAPYCNFASNGMFQFAVYLNDHTEVSIQQSFISSSYIQNKDLGFKFVYDSSLSTNQAKLYWNAPGSWILLNQKNMASLCWDEPLNIGTATAATLSNYFLGSIDLSQWSITVNGQAWWPFTPWS